MSKLNFNKLNLHGSYHINHLPLKKMKYHFSLFENNFVPYKIPCYPE